MKIAVLLLILLIGIYVFKTGETKKEVFAPKKTTLTNPRELEDNIIENQKEEHFEEDIFNQELKDLQQEIASSPVASVSPEVTPIKSEKVEEDEPFSLTEDEVSQLGQAGNIEINIPGQNNPGLIGGVHRNRAAQAISRRLNNEDSSEEETANNTELPRVGGQVRGYNMLYLMHPKARETVERQLIGLEVANLEDNYLSVLVDGTFGKDFNYLENVIRRINEHADSLTLVLYLSNGSTMRRFNTTKIDASFNKIDPEQFRNLIRFDNATREKFKNMTREAKPAFDLNRSLNSKNQNIAIVMLEDNLQYESYIAMRDLAKEVLGNTVEYLRNPCFHCYDGNDTATDGDSIEYHSPGFINFLKPGDAFSNDGTSYRYSWESPEHSKIFIDDLENLAEGLTDTARYFGIWRRERQGLYEAIPSQHPDERTYEVPTEDQLVEDLELLRAGLDEVE